MFSRVLAVMGKEFIQIKRDRRTLAMIIAIPVVWLIMFGYAADFNVRHLKLIIQNNSDSRVAQVLVAAFEKSESFKIVGSDLRSEDEIRDYLRLDKADLALLIPEGFGGPSGDSTLKVLVDGADFFSAQSAAGLIQKVLQGAQEELQAELIRSNAAAVKDRLIALLPAPARALMASGMVNVESIANSLPANLPRLVPEMEFLFNPEVKSSVFMIPGLAAMVILFITALMTALGVVRERERGTLEQLAVSPVRPFELMVGKVVPYALVGLLDFTLVLLAAVYIFGVPFAGNVGLFYLVTTFFLLSALGLGLVASAAAQNQQQAMQMTMFMVFPQMLISGVIFPLEAMPAPIVAIAKLMPLTYYVPVARGMFIKGLGLDAFRGQTVALLVYGAAMIVVASILFRRKLD